MATAFGFHSLCIVLQQQQYLKSIFWKPFRMHSVCVFHSAFQCYNIEMLIEILSVLFWQWLVWSYASVSADAGYKASWHKWNDDNVCVMYDKILHSISIGCYVLHQQYQHTICATQHMDDNSTLCRYIVSSIRLVQCKTEIASYLSGVLICKFWNSDSNFKFSFAFASRNPSTTVKFELNAALDRCIM